MPNVLDVRFVGVDLSTLLDFLARHPSVKVVRLDGVLDLRKVQANPLALPNLSRIEGDEVQISRFLKFLEPRSRFQSLSVFFRDDFNLDTPPSPFDASACLSALRRLGELHGDASISLKFNFMSLRQFTSQFFHIRRESRPEVLLCVDMMQVNFSGFPPALTAMLLSGCIKWLTLFNHISVLRVGIAEGVITDEDRKRYLQVLMERFETATITL
ncbi:hypothetical protein SCHPADRAFT_948245 [Schizopora paradoxa]|uniref:F-box domain-containing protein n=1 Tax=Schizopora paradoxa TaxID=27342 RepID=A0A0H2QWA1_9AGAM|nr:hypothetical protein SCHPADRAFT_948245 [Schizopora paradoxa]